MAHRRRVASGRLTLFILGSLLLGLMLAGRVFVSNQVTGLRAEIAALEDRREFLEAGSAQLLAHWNAATASAVVTARARRELGLICPDTPDPVLVRLDESVSDPGGAWRRWLDGFGGGEPARAADGGPGSEVGTMVSLAPLATDGTANTVLDRRER